MLRKVPRCKWLDAHSRGRALHPSSLLFAVEKNIAAARFLLMGRNNSGKLLERFELRHLPAVE